ncbi:hypothetical protein [Enterovibrio calviensis]|uniref:hypothetical protein n=1 Tax=Enterovibrio calviensis TaxID=91359 RepID=UPI0004822CC0|nr:hypothetical protein [Enterovibrio calviensis]
MNKIGKYIGIVLIAFGVITLMQLLFNLPDYLRDFPNNPIYEYIVGTDEKSYFATLEGSEVVISNDIMRIVALFFGFMILKIWITVGSTLINAGRSLLIDDMENVKGLLNTLINKKE